MSDKIKGLTFEQIDDFHFRAKVPGGWIVKATEPIYHNWPDFGSGGLVGGYNWRIAMCFVPDPNHEWK